MSMRALREQQQQTIEKIGALKARIQEKRAQLVDTNIANVARQHRCPTVSLGSQDLVCCRTLHGHTGKIYSLDWAQGIDRLVSASQDGYLIVWNALTSQKTHAIKLACPWVMTCAFSPNGQAVACGGLDSVCTVITLSTQQGSSESDRKILSGHKGYISCCKYVPDQSSQLVTSSGDWTCALWDCELGQKISTFGGDTSSGHTADVMSLSVSSKNPQQFVSGSCDWTARLWDMRIANRLAQTYQGHRGDVNAVQFFPDGLRFGTGSDDGSCRVFDIRTGHQLQQFNQNAKANSIAFSSSGRLLFVAYSNKDCIIWDTLTAGEVCNLKNFSDPHSDVVSCLGLASDGTAMCTGSWDKSLKIWVPDSGKN